MQNDSIFHAYIKCRLKLGSYISLNVDRFTTVYKFTYSFVSKGNIWWYIYTVYTI